MEGDCVDHPRVIIIAADDLLGGKIPHLSRSGWATCCSSDAACHQQQGCVPADTMCGNARAAAQAAELITAGGLAELGTPGPQGHHTLTHRSSPPDTASLQSGDTWTDRTQFWWPDRVKAKRWVGRAQTCDVQHITSTHGYMGVLVPKDVVRAYLSAC